MKPVDPGGVWDAVVVGAGPAGAVAAFVLGRLGVMTLLVDRSRFPRSKVCGGCLSAASLDQLGALGLGSTVRNLPGVRFSRLRVGNGIGPTIDIRLPPGLSVSRTVLDDALVGAAVDVGARFLAGVQARVAPAASCSAATRPVSLIQTDGTVRTVEARVVVAADGLSHPSLAGLSDVGQTVAPRSRIGVGGSLLGARARYARGTIFMAVGRDGYVGLVRAENDVLNIAAALAPAAARRPGGVREAVGAVLRNASFEIPSDLGSIPWCGTPPLTRRLHRPAGHRLLVVGDAGGYAEPFTGQGISWALADGAAVGACVVRGIGRWSRQIEDDWVATHRRLVGAGQTRTRLIGALLRSRTAVTWGLRTLEHLPGLAAPVVRFANGGAAG